MKINGKIKAGPSWEYEYGDMSIIDPALQKLVLYAPSFPSLLALEKDSQNH